MSPIEIDMECDLLVSEYCLMAVTQETTYPQIEVVLSYWTKAEAMQDNSRYPLYAGLASYSNDFSPWYTEFLSRLDRYGINPNGISRLDSAYQIIQKWGGIQSFKRTPKNDERISELITFVDVHYPLVNGQQPAIPQEHEYEETYQRLRDLSLANIASISKLLHFLRPNLFFVYDSRVSYSLNTILLQEQYAGKLFSVLPARNGTISSNKGYWRDVRKQGRLSIGDTYISYCILIQTLYRSVHKDIAIQLDGIESDLAQKLQACTGFGMPLSSLHSANHPMAVEQMLFGMATAEKFSRKSIPKKLNEVIK